jgi:hypothetical protein
MLTNCYLPMSTNCYFRMLTNCYLCMLTNCYLRFIDCDLKIYSEYKPKALNLMSRTRNVPK